MCSSRRAAGALLAAGCTVLALAACGKKGDPLPPLLPVPRAAEDLTVQQRGPELILRFAYPQTTAAGLPLGELERIEVYELARPALAAPVTEPAPTETAPGWLSPPIDAREFVAAAKVVLTLRAGDLAGAVRGDRLAVTLPQELPPPDPPQARYFAVRTVAEGDFASGYSNRAAIVPQTPPPAPRELTAVARADGIEIGWQAEEDPGIAGFDVYRRLSTERDFGEPLQLVAPAERSFVDAGARYGQRYLYAVTAVGQRSPLVESAVAAAREVDYRDLFAPPVPASVVALADAGAVRLVWDESRAPDLTGYHVYRRRGDGEWQRLTAEPTTEVEYADPDVAPGEPYAYRVTAVDELGNESEPSAVAETLLR